MPDSLPDTIGPYRILGILGQGGMGVVLRAWEPALGREVALKLAQVDLKPSRRRRFLREAEALAQLRHPHVVPVHAVGEHDGQPYLVMERVPGEDLRARQQRSPPLAPAEVVRMGEALARALHAVHSCGLIHRDVKPENVLLTPDGRPLLTDFGLARRRELASLTPTGQVVGTVAYMAPEQAQGRTDLDPRADVYSLGATLYDLLCGQPPFLPPRVRAKVVHRRPRPLRAWVPELDPELERVVMACLAKEREDRYPDAQALAEDLARYRRGDPVRVEALGPLRRLWRRARRRGLLVPLALGATALAAAAGFSLWLALREPPQLEAAVALEAEGVEGRLLSEGARLLARGDFVLAGRAYAEAGSLLPAGGPRRARAQRGLARAWEGRAQRLDGRKDVPAEERLAAWRRAAELAPANPQVLLGFALCLDDLVEDPDDEETLRVVVRAIEAGSQDIRAFALRGNELVHFERLDEAHADEQRVLALDPSGQTAALLQHRLMQAHARRALKLRGDAPEQATAHVERGLGLSLRAKGFVHPTFEEFIPLEVHPLLFAARGWLALDRGEVEAALADAKRAQVHPNCPEASVLEAVARETFALGERAPPHTPFEPDQTPASGAPTRTGDAVPFALEPGMPQRLVEGLVFRRKGEMRKAEHSLKHFLADHFAVPKAERSEQLLRWLRLARRERNLACAARGHLRKCMAALVANKRRKLRNIVERHRESFRDPKDRGYAVEYITAVLRARPEAAPRLIVELRLHAPDLPATLTESARLALDEGRLADAFGLVQHACDLLVALVAQDARAPVERELGGLLEACERRPPSAPASPFFGFLERERVYPPDVKLLNALAQRALTKQRFLAARAILGKMLTLEPGHTGARLRRARLFLEVLGDPSRALAELAWVPLDASPADQREAAALKAACQPSPGSASNSGDTSQ